MDGSVLSRATDANAGKLPCILIIDDEPAIVDFVQLGLRYEGYAVQTAAGGPEGLTLAQSLKPDLVVLDIMLPGLDGFEVCRRLRAIGDVPIVMLTARDEVADRVEGLNLGADDYLTKPFTFEELLARIRAVLRRKSPGCNPVLQYGDVSLDPHTRDVNRGGRPIPLTAREFDLMQFFLRHPRQALSREVIMNGVWGYDFLGDTNVIEVYVRYLRAKLGDPPLIQTVRGVGYSLRG